MEIILYTLIVVLAYKLIMPFIGWIVPERGMNNAAKYIERTERRFPTKDVVNTLTQWWQKKRGNKKQ